MLEVQKAIAKVLPEVSRVAVFGHRFLTNLCSTSSMHSSANISGTENDLRKKKKQNRVSLIYPKLPDNVQENKQTIASFHITNSFVSWAKMSCTRNLLEWDIVKVPKETEKLHVTAIYDMVLKIGNVLPKADLYVLEDLSRPKQSSSGAFHVNLYMLQFRAIMTAYLNQFEVPYEEIGGTCVNKVFFLRPHLAARLSSTLVGGEKIAVEQTVRNILNLSGQDASCPQYSPIHVDWTLKQNYTSKDNLDKEIMGQALLLLMAFNDLVLSKTPDSLRHIGR